MTCSTYGPPQPPSSGMTWFMVSPESIGGRDVLVTSTGLNETASR